jgi:DNA-binding NtrC family response regulator
MTRYDWPGNVRELRNVVERAVLLSEVPSSTTMLRGGVGPHGGASAAPQSAAPAIHAEVDVDTPFKVAKRQIVDQFESEYVRALLDRHGGNISAAARAAGLDRMSIYRIAERQGLLDKK